MSTPQDITLILWLRLYAARGIGPLIAKRFFETFQDIHALWEATDKQLLSIGGIGQKAIQGLRHSSLQQARDQWDACQKIGIQIIHWQHPDYPEALFHITDPPIVLFVYGDISTLTHTPMLAVIGARRATHEIRKTTSSWCKQLASDGVGVVSGLAFGIDQAAHAGAINQHAPTIAVLGCGHRKITAQQREIVTHIKNNGCIISEYEPDTEAHTSSFPRRNRIISGLSQAVLIMQATLKSGSLITARQALEQGRDVMAVPGSIIGNMHSGCHQMIRDGAALVESISDIYTVMNWQTSKAGNAPLPKAQNESEASILGVLEQGVLHIDALAEQCGLSIAELSQTLIGLELRTAITRLPGQRYAICKEA